MQSKVKTPFYFSLCKFYMTARGFERENRFLSCENMPQHRSPIVSITHLSGPSVANTFASLIQRDRHPPNHLYGTSNMSSVEPVSPKRVRSVGGRFIRHCRNAK